MDREAWRAVVHGVEKESDTTERLNWTEPNRKARKNLKHWLVLFTYFEGHYAIMYRNFSKPSSWQAHRLISANQNLCALAPPPPRLLGGTRRNLPVSGCVPPGEADAPAHRALIGWELTPWACRPQPRLLRVGARRGRWRRVLSEARFKACLRPPCRTAGPAAMLTISSCRRRSPNYGGEAYLWLASLTPSPTAPLTGR